MKDLKQFIQEEINNLNKSIVATPHDREALESFAKCNHGASDMILTQMAVQYGYKLALELVQKQLTPLKNIPGFLGTEKG